MTFFISSYIIKTDIKTLHNFTDFFKKIHLKTVILQKIFLQKMGNVIVI